MKEYKQKTIDSLQQMVFLKVSTSKNTTAPIWQVVYALKKEFGDRNVIFHQPLKNKGTGYHCFINIILPPKEE